MSSPSVVEIRDWLADTGWPDDESGVLAMFKVAVDESGTHANAAVLCVAACVATSTQWGHLIREWVPVVRRLPKGYHAKLPSCGEANRILSELIARRCELVIAVTIKDSEFKRLTDDKFRSVYGSVYTLAILSCTFVIGQWCHGNKHKWAKYIFESGHKNQAYTQRLLSWAMNASSVRRRMRMFSHEWVGKGEPILHAADLVSHEWASSYGGSASQLLSCIPSFTPSHLGEAEIVETLEIMDHEERRYRQPRRAGRA